ncbi:MAG: ABC transporter permease, partial [Rhizobium leguminosarum]
MTAIGETGIPSAVDRTPSRAWRKLKANKGALVGLAIIAFFA